MPAGRDTSVDWVVGRPKPACAKLCLTLAAVPADLGKRFQYPPDFAPAAPTRQYSVGDIQELIDGRGFTDMSTVWNHSVVNMGGYVAVRATVIGTATKQGRFKAGYIVSWRETDSRDVVWVGSTHVIPPPEELGVVEDGVPAGAKLRGDMERWNWVASPVFSGTKAHQSANQRGRHQHYFFGTSNPLNVAVGDTLFACVYLDPAAIPCEVMLQWNDGTWEHRAYWGASLIDWGRWHGQSLPMGPIPMEGSAGFVWKLPPVWSDWKERRSVEWRSRSMVVARRGIMQENAFRSDYTRSDTQARPYAPAVFTSIDHNEIRYTVEPNIVANDTVQFRLCLGGG